mgnify:CR=1 FL=1|tara:strand:- start:963 stop:1154 length:192 start_codon:yes stop_codon:yes gene_type:complete
MNFYNELKIEIEVFQQHVSKANKNQLTKEFKETKQLCKEFGFTTIAEILKESLAEDKQKKVKN